jgi:hypothetical protein
MKIELSGSEAVFGFLGWLTTRKVPVTFSAKHDASEAANLAKEFCDANRLEEPKEGWEKELAHPVDK